MLIESTSLKSTIPITLAPPLRLSFIPSPVSLINFETSESDSIVSVKASLYFFHVVSKSEVLYIVPASMQVLLISSTPTARLQAYTHVWIYTLTMSFHRRQFSTLSDVLAHISDYS